MSASPSVNSGKIIAVVGPTATGKTMLGVALAKALASEVISADSRVIYRELDIGTAKPTMMERQGIPHYLMDVVDPPDMFSAAQYRQTALPILERLLADGKIPVVVGGTGFYLRALLQDNFIPPAPPDHVFREAMQQLAEAEGTLRLHQRLVLQDPARAAEIHPNDRFRTIRALEIIHQTGRPVPKISPESPSPFDILWLGLTYADRDTHRAEINRRIDTMLQQGWLTEVSDLLERYGPSSEALRVTHGYPELVRHLQGKMSLEEAVTQIRINIHQYSRRQMTWFRRNPDIHWLEVDKIAPEEGMLRTLQRVETWTGPSNR